MKIGELADRCGCKAATACFYESEGLLTTARRTKGNYRSYDEDHAERLGFILRCRALDMPHDRIRVLLQLQQRPSEPCEPVIALLDAHLAEVEHRLARMTALRAELLAIRGRCGGGMSTAQCRALGSIQASACCPAD